jgi:hypothetical protein
MAFAREHGYCFFVRNQRVPVWDPDSAFNAEHNEFPVELPSVLKADEDYQLGSVVAPIFDESHQVAFLLGLGGFIDRVRGTRIEKMGRHLREACDRITLFMAGDKPQSDMLE